MTLLTTSYYLLLNERRDRAHKKFFKTAQKFREKRSLLLKNEQVFVVNTTGLYC